MSAAGLDISDQAIRFMKFSENKNGLIPKLFGEEKLPQGIIVSGEIIKKDELIKILSSLKQKYSLNFVKVSLPEEKAYFFKTEIPKVENGEIRQSIEFRLEENVPVKVDEALFDYSVITEDHMRNDHLDVIVSVVPKQLAESYAEVLEKSGLTAVSFEVESKAIARSAIKDGSGGSVMIINIRDRVTVVTLVRGGTVRFTSAFAIGGNLITEALQKNFSVSFSEAEKIKNEKLYSENKESIAIFFSLANIVSVIKDEIGKFYTYWLAKNDSSGESGGKISKIILCGKDAAIVGLKEYLSQNLKIEVETAQVWTNVLSLNDRLPEINFLESLNFAVAIGLAIPQDKN
ncbi:MAG: Type IV pilus assembly protein PilM [Parcubacteria group bacterium GW2011_GWA2_42_18]|nr:MAG: Type IV pilus assembly protein PilM [Parcubacteria group bacterium GW2011_GWA2_42_18]